LRADLDSGELKRLRKKHASGAQASAFPASQGQPGALPASQPLSPSQTQQGPQVSAFAAGALGRRGSGGPSGSPHAQAGRGAGGAGAGNATALDDQAPNNPGAGTVSGDERLPLQFGARVVQRRGRGPRGRLGARRGL